MQENSLFQMKEKLEKKFYRTKSESYRLNELNTKIGVLQEGKKRLKEEFKEKMRKSKNQPFNKKVFRSIYSELLNTNKDLQKKKKNYNKKIKRIKEDCKQKKIICKKSKKSNLVKQDGLIDCEKKIQQEEYIKFQLHNKIASISSDIDISRNRIITFAEMEGINKKQLEKITGLKLIGEFKKFFSYDLLKQKKKNIKRIVKTSENNFARQNISFNKKKRSISKLYDECAWQNLDMKKKQKEFKETMEEIKRLEKGKEEEEKLNGIRKRVFNFYQKLKMISENVENNYIADIKHKSNVETKDDNGDCIGLVDNILIYYSDLNYNINQGYKAVNILSAQLEKEKTLLVNCCSAYEEVKTDSKEKNKEEKYNHRIENTISFINAKDLIYFLFRSKNFIFLFSKRIKQLIDSINKICGLLDFNLIFNVKRLSFSKSLKLNKKIFLETTDGEKQNKGIPSSILENISVTDDQLNSLNSCRSINHWVEKTFPYYGNYNGDKPYSSHILNFFDSIINNFDNFTNFLKEIVVTMKGEFKLTRKRQTKEDHFSQLKDDHIKSKRKNPNTQNKTPQKKMVKKKYTSDSLFALQSKENKFKKVLVK